MQNKSWAKAARQASYALAALPLEERNRALKGMARALEAHQADIFSANAP